MVDNSSRPSAATPAFKSAERERRFFAAYDAVLDQWPIAVDTADVRSEHGTTRVNMCGPVDGTPLILLHGGGATSTVWFANVGALSRSHRVYAVDTIGDAGRSLHDGQPLRGVTDLIAWLDAVLVDLGLDHADLCGHSYGGWLALSYALHAPHRVRKLVLLDPTSCFSGMNLGYRLRAVPLFVRPTAPRMRAFIRWETGGLPVNAAWLELVALGAADFPSSKIVMPHRPKLDQLEAWPVPTLLLLAENSKAHDIRRVAAAARRLIPDAETAVLAGATHHSIPTEQPDPLNHRLVDFLA